MEHERPHVASLGANDYALAVMRHLAEQCASWPLVRDLVEADVEEWPRLRDQKRRAAFERTLKRTMTVAPWVLDKGRVRDATRVLGQ